MIFWDSYSTPELVINGITTNNAKLLQSNTKSAISGAGTVYPSGVPFGPCTDCPSANYGFWLPLWYLQTFLRLNGRQNHRQTKLSIINWMTDVTVAGYSVNICSTNGEFHSISHFNCGSSEFVLVINDAKISFI